ncbi:hypothetical protein Asi02nite_60140 [Asanoa siamensis]|uniref:Type I-U CRISPR-associated protein Csx17 n=1 Tax=Asanoa siamensis TaxID=926357 RepID=A0ABQ4CYX9_9ACTN|nr:hypothetical protein Asi02nite_60140 [Asanoa siamensis]
MATATIRARGWALFDEIVAAASREGYTNPWRRPDSGGDPIYEPDYDTLERLLGVPLLLGATSQTGVPALALDVWAAYELRRSGFSPDVVWPRAEAPRVLPTDVALLLRSLPLSLQGQVRQAVGRGAGSANANILGKNYVKQVDVGISAWNTGPELLISTKRMDSSFGKNAANRVEESYGDAKNLRLRHPLAALGFLYGLRSTALTTEPEKAAWLIDLLAKLGEEDDAYHAVGLLIPHWGDDHVEPPSDQVGEDPRDDPLVAAGVQAPLLDAPEGADDRNDSLSADLDRLPTVILLRGQVPPELDPGRFLGLMVSRVLKHSPINFHLEARERRASCDVLPAGGESLSLW